MKAIVTFALSLLSTIAVAQDWNVGNMPGPKQEVLLDVTEGTWMSLDVSPDGKTIAFDLLGDIYLLPIDGGDAQAVASGPAWDMQPRFSPDGSALAFTSDRNGAANLWVMKADGSQPRAVSNEQFHTLNNPTWTADGNYIAGRKHYTTWRSLGTGEIWIYHVTGGKGVPLVERRSQTLQKELGEPIFSADGKALYYSENVTPGDLFVYAQDSNKQTFQIKRYDMATGETSAAVSGNGGAVRATPSPDGRYIAFVRRLRERSALYLKDLASSELTLLNADLDRDMQETWAIHGVYPNMDWTPDSRSIVYWAGGKILRLRVADKSIEEIPFRVRQTHIVNEPPRFKVDVAPESFDTRMHRWASASPDGKAVVYESLGRLYIKKADKEARLLTRDGDGRRELFPSWSRDGKSIAFVSWTDEELGSVRKVSARGGNSRVLTSEPGYYRRPMFSPNGAQIVVEKSGSSGLTSQRWSENPGIYLLPARGGELSKVTSNGRDPHFGAANERIFITRTKNSSAIPGARNVGGEEHLVSVDLNGEAERTHAVSDRATRLLISPTEEWLVFRENYNVYLMPLPPSPAAVKVGVPERDSSDRKKAFPVQRMSKDGGEFPSWQHDDGLVWSMGAMLFSAQVPLQSEAIQGQNLSMTIAADKPNGYVALTNARIVTMNAQQQVIKDGVVLIEDNRIVEVGAVGDVSIPASAKIADLNGKTIIPGLIDAHAHGPQGEKGLVPQQNWSNLAAVALGVTTIHDPSNRGAHIYAAAELQRAGKILAPRIYSTGEIVYGARSEHYAVIDSLDDARSHIRRLKSQGAISVKNYNQPRREQRQQINVAAREAGLMVVAEGGSLYHLDMSLLTDGVTGLEHNVPVAPLYDDVMQLWRSTPVAYTLTLNVNYAGLPGENYWYQQSEVWQHPLLSRYVPPRVLQPRAVRRAMAPEAEYTALKNSSAAGKALAQAGVYVNIGGHGQREGLGAHWEMWSFALGGMSPMQALHTGTLAPAQHLGMDADLGSIEAGKLADLIVLDANPLDDIHNSDNISQVMLNGRLYEASTLNEVVTGDRKLRDVYWWSEPQSELLNAP